MKRAMYVILFLLTIGYVYLYFNPVFICKKPTKSLDNPQWVNDLCNPVEGIDFTCGDNKIIIYTYREDLRSLPEGVKKRVLLFCTDNSIIENIKKNFEFERKSEEYLETTASGSKIYFFKNNRVVFHSPIILDGNTSIHSQETGWIFSTRHEILKESFTKFKPLYNPIVVL